MSTEKELLNDQIHMHQPGQGLGSSLLVPIFSSDEIASYEHNDMTFRRKL